MNERYEIKVLFPNRSTVFFRDKEYTAKNLARKYAEEGYNVTVKDNQIRQFIFRMDGNKDPIIIK